MLPDARLRLLREHRVRPDRGSIAETLLAQRARLERAARQDGGISEAWSAVVPEALALRAVVVGLKGGVLTVRCRSAADKFTLDRWLRSGGERALRAAGRVPLKKVRLVLR